MGKGGIITGYAFLFLGVLYFYYNDSFFRSSFDKWNSDMEAWTIHGWYGVDFSVLDFVTSLVCCLRYRHEFKAEKSWLEVFMSGLIMQFGGTTLAGLLLGQVPCWMMSRSAFPSYVLAWWLVFNFPLDFFYSFLKTPIGSVIMFVVGALTSVAMAHAISSWGMDKALFNDFHGNSRQMWKSYVICIAVGAISGSGGGLLADALGFFRDEPRKSFTLVETPNVFTVNRFDVSASVNRGFWLALWYYYFLQHGADLSLAPESLFARTTEAHSLLTIVFLVLYLMQRNIDFDPFYLVTRGALLFTYVTRVMNPYYYDKLE